MPIYEYECEECKKVVEAIQSFSDAPLTDCPSCSGTLQKLISKSSFHLKGGGWYADGYNGCSNDKPSKAKPEAKTSSTPPAACPKKAEGAPACGGCAAAAS